MASMRSAGGGATASAAGVARVVPLALMAVASVGLLATGCQPGEPVAADREARPGARAPLPQGDVDGDSDGDGDRPGLASTITLVRNGDGGTQVREASATVVVITGTDLAGASDVTVATCHAQITSATATEVRAITSPCARLPRGMATVSVTTPSGTASLPAALEVTPFVISPMAPMTGGRGTFEAPMHLCDPEIPLWADTGALLYLLGGAHVCGGLFLFGGVDVEGALDGSTVIRGDGTGFTLWLNGSSHLRRLTFEAPLGEVSLSLGEGDYTVEEVTGGRLAASGTRALVLDDYSFEGDGVALDLAAESYALSDVTVRCASGAGTGVRLIAPEARPQLGNGTVARVQVSHCGRGVQIDRRSPFHQTPVLQLEDLELVDNVVGLGVVSGDLTVRDLTVRGDPATPLVSQLGVAFSGHRLNLLGGEISGQTVAGISQETSTPGGGNPDPVAQLFVDQFEIAGGPIGIEFSGYDGGTDLKLRRSVIRDQTVACVRARGHESWIDLGTAGEPGGNALSVVSGYAIEDARTDTAFGFYFYIDAHGTTLNGLGYDGNVIDGPALISPDFRIPTWNSGLRF